MTVETVRVVSYGRPATLTLAEVIAAAKRAHPLDPVTVVVPSNLAGLSARRLLGGGTSRADSPSGVANVAFVTPFRLAELLGAGHLAGRRPLTNPVLAAAVRAVLRDEPGYFALVAEHHATEAALVAAYADLSHAESETLDAIAAASRRGAEVVRLHRAVRERLRDFSDEDDLVAAARARIQTDPGVAESLGTVVWHLPDRSSPAIRQLVGRVLSLTPSALIVGLTGDPDADRAVLASCRSAGIDVTADQTEVVPATGTRIISVSDPDEEVRAALRELMALAEAGTPLDRMAVLYPSPDPYARALHEQLTTSGIPHNGPARTRLADSVAGRTLLAALALPGAEWGRGAVMALVAGGPVRHNGRLAPVSRWEAISRIAGVVGGRGSWGDRLRGWAGSGRAEGDRDAANELASFVEALQHDLDELDRRSTWAGRAHVARQLLTRLLGPEQRRTTWPGDEVDAAERVDAALSRLVVLDDVDPASTSTSFTRAVAAELDEPAGRVGRFGEGVLFGPLAAAAGLDLDAVIVLGMAEGSCPGPRRRDSLLPDEDRERAVAGELLLGEDRLADQHRALLAALATASGPRLVLHPRGDLRGGRDRLPSRWLLPTAAALAGRERVHSSDFAALEQPVVTVVPSFTRGVAAAPAPASASDRDLAALLAHVEAGRDPVEHAVAAGDLARGLECRRARHSSAFTVWDGNLAGQPVPSPAAGEVLSATRLERWAACPFRYFLGSVLGLGERDDPERITEIGAADRGLLIHEVLERFLREVMERPAGPPAPAEPWSTADHDRLTAIAGDVFARYEAEGRTGRPLTWQVTRTEVLADLSEFLHHDNAYREADGATPAQVEMAFGFDEAEPLMLELPGDRVLRFRGRADRVDTTDVGGHVVLDYKTGTARRYKDLETDPVLAGRTLQLGLYAEAAHAQLDASAVESRYWLATSRGNFSFIGYPWTAGRRERFVSVLEAIVEGIEAGVYPARPGAYEPFFRSHEECRWCDFDRLCPRERSEHEAAKAGAPELTVLDRLLPPEQRDRDA